MTTLLLQRSILLGHAGAASHDGSLDTRWLTQWTYALLALGIAWRLLRYFLQFPIWGDEILFGLNLVERDFHHLFQPLGNCQVAPPLFLVGEWAAFHFLGSGELAMRLLPQLAAILALLLFKPVAERTLKPLPAALAIGILAVSFWPVSMSTLAKPYAFDLLGTVLFLYGVVRYLEDPSRSRWLWVLAGIAPLIVGVSYPSVFIAGAVSLCLLPSLWRNRHLSNCAAYIGFNLAWMGTFVFVVVFLVGRTTEATRLGMELHWQESFPPSGVLPFLKWLVVMNTGQMFAYPIGDRNGGSVVTTLLFLVGIWEFVRRRRMGLVILSLAPFVIGILAAYLHRYPYGGVACRIHQHVAPLIILAAAEGLALLVGTVFRNPAWRKKCAITLFAVYAVIPVAGMARDAIKPYRESNDVWTRKLVQALSDEFQPDDLIVINLKTRKGLVFDWYTLPWRDRWVPLDRVSDEALTNCKGNIWLLTCAFLDDPAWIPAKDDPEAIRLDRRLTSAGEWQWRDQIPYLYQRTDQCRMLDYCLVHRWTKASKPPPRNLIVGPGR